MVPLNFGNGRKEFNIIGFSNNLDQLVNVLEDPVSFFRTVQAQFGYDASVSKSQQFPWSLRPPVTAILRPGYPKVGATAEDSSNLRFAKAVNFAGYSLEGRTLGQLLATFQADHKFGAFFAEFALNTRTLFITYFEPRLDLDDDPIPHRYQGGITPVTKSEIADPISPVGPQAYLHFDLMKAGDIVTPLDRANYIVSYIEDRDFLRKTLEKESNITTSSSMMTLPGGATFKPSPSSVGLAPPYKSRTTLLPTITVEGLSDGTGPIEPCTLAPVMVAGATLEYGDILVKSY